MNQRGLMILFSVCAAIVSAEGVLPVPEFNDRPVDPTDSQRIEEAIPEASFVARAAPRRLLVVSATNGFRHRSIPHGKLALQRMGETTGAYTVEISDDPANFEIEQLETFDAVCLLNPTLDFLAGSDQVFKALSKEEQNARVVENDRLMDNLVDYVKQGGGLVGIHSASDCCYNHESYGQMIGGYFNGHPWTADKNVTIVVEDPEHALIKPVFNTPDFPLVEEMYQFKAKPYSRDNLRVLLHLDPERSDEPRSPANRDDNDYAVSWVQEVGEGRVFYTSIGHNEHIYWDPTILRHYLAGIQYACGDLPADATPSGQRDR